MKPYVVFGSILSLCIIVVWVLCAKYLSLAIEGFFPNTSHESHVDIWFAGFVISEIVAVSVVTYVAAKKGLFGR